MVIILAKEFSDSTNNLPKKRKSFAGRRQNCQNFLSNLAGSSIGIYTILSCNLLESVGIPLACPAEASVSELKDDSSLDCLRAGFAAGESGSQAEC
jgi:hypothetical protein